ncbi:hypothetical protein CL619_02240 [archaeon]|nr:hypothetical protein [archaeon]|tara:strand:- start:896 stop:1693 length:798 start_codon:yes stop_codon:yes gene_type:complete
MNATILTLLGLAACSSSDYGFNLQKDSTLGGAETGEVSEGDSTDTAFDTGMIIEDTGFEASDYDTGRDTGLIEDTDSTPYETNERWSCSETPAANLGCKTLEDYADCYVNTETGFLNAILVVGEGSSASDSLAMTDLFSAMTYTNSSGVQEPVEMLDAIRYDSEIDDITMNNTILIGSLEVNSLTQSLVGEYHPAPSLKEDEAVVGICTHAIGTSSLVVAGYNDHATRMAAQVIANRKDELQGDVMVVETPNGTYNWESATLRNP